MNKAFNFSFHSSTTLLYYKDNNYEQKYILKTSVFNFCGSMLPGFADFNAKNNKKNLHDCNEYMNNDELRNTLKFSQLSRYANKQATTKLPRYTQSVAWLHSVHLLCTRQSVNGANRDHYTNNLNNVSYGKNNSKTSMSAEEFVTALKLFQQRKQERETGRRIMPLLIGIGQRLRLAERRITEGKRNMITEYHLHILWREGEILLQPLHLALT